MDKQQREEEQCTQVLVGEAEWCGKRCQSSDGFISVLSPDVVQNFTTVAGIRGGLRNPRNPRNPRNSRLPLSKVKPRVRVSLN